MFYKEMNLVETSVAEIPKQWNVVKIEDIALSKKGAIKIGPFGSQIKKSEMVPKGVKIYGQENVIENNFGIGNRYISPDKYERLKNFEIFPGDILITMMGSIGYAALFPENASKGIMDSHLLRIQVKKELVLPTFLLQIVGSSIIKKQIRSISRGAIMSGLNSETVRSIGIPLPPLDEQAEIVGVLGVVDSAIELVNRVIWKTERLKKGLMQTLLTKGIGHTEYKDTPIGRIPKEWEVDKLESVVEIHDSKRIPLSEMERKGRKGPYPYCGANGIIDHINDFIFDGEYVLLAEDGGSYGKFESSAYVMSGKFWVNNHAHILRANAEKTSNQFLKLTLDFLDLNPYIVGSTRKKLNQEQMRGINIPLPPVPEQQRIAEIFSEVDKKLEVERSEKARLERVKRGLMDLLLTGRIRVKVD